MASDLKHQIRLQIEAWMCDARQLRTYMLVNPAAVHGLELQMPPNAWPHGLSVVDEGLEIEPDVKPFLIDLREPGGDALSTWWADHAGRASCLSLIASPHSGQALSRALRERMRVRLDDGTPLLMRLFDGRVLEQARNVLSAEQWRVVCAGIAEWIYADRDGCLHDLTLSESRSETTTLPLCLSAAQVDAWIDAGTADRLLPRLGPHWSRYVASRPRGEAHGLLSDAICAAQRAGLKEAKQWLAYCEVLAREGPGFELRSRWADALRSLAAHRLSAEDFIAKEFS